jgi:hypothetical protein
LISRQLDAAGVDYNRDDDLLGHGDETTSIGTQAGRPFPEATTVRVSTRFGEGILDESCPGKSGVAFAAAAARSTAASLSQSVIETIRPSSVAAQ